MTFLLCHTVWKDKPSQLALVRPASESTKLIKKLHSLNALPIISTSLISKLFVWIIMTSFLIWDTYWQDKPSQLALSDLHQNQPRSLKYFSIVWLYLPIILASLISNLFLWIFLTSLLIWNTEIMWILNLSRIIKELLQSLVVFTDYFNFQHFFNLF